MSVLLAVETSGPLCSLAIHAEGRWFEHTHNVDRLHNRVVLANLDALAASAGVSSRGFDVVAFGAGPASFTGVRIAASVAQGVAFACDALVAPVPSPLALAEAARNRRPDGVGRLITVTRSRRDAYYLAGFNVSDSDRPVPWLHARLHQGESPPQDLPADCIGAGDRPPWWSEGVPFLDDLRVTASIVGTLALGMLQRGECVTAEAALPIYVSGDSPWRAMTS